MESIRLVSAWTRPSRNRNLRGNNNRRRPLQSLSKREEECVHACACMHVYHSSSLNFGRKADAPTTLEDGTRAKRRRPIRWKIIVRVVLARHSPCAAASCGATIQGRSRRPAVPEDLGKRRRRGHCTFPDQDVRFAGHSREVGVQPA